MSAFLNRSSAGWLVLGAALFAVAHTQAPLYTSNQNQYFLHGLAQAGLGQLQDDWLAKTTDPTLAFSAAVAWVYQHLPEWSFHAAYAAILGVYFASLMWLAHALPFGPRSQVNRLRLAMALIVIHAAVVRWGSVQLTGSDYPWFFQAGLANQYVLGPGLQPSTFGVFLIAAVAAFANQRLILAAVCLVAACTFHATYLLPAALLVLGFMHVLWWEGRRAVSVGFGACLLLGVLPITIDSLRRFAPSSAEAMAQANDILINFRIPHHARWDCFFDWLAGCQVLWALIGVGLVRKSRLFPVLLIAFLGGVAMSLLVMVRPALALLFPWRISVVLVPVATTVILSRLIAGFHPDRAAGSAEPVRPIPAFALVSIMAVMAACGVILQSNGLAYQTFDHVPDLFQFVRNSVKPGDVYLLPVRIPPRPPPRGAPSGTFAPWKPSAETASSVDLQRFRLATGAPIYVDFKSIPYRDVEVLEWRCRIELAAGWTLDGTLGSAAGETSAEALSKLGISHIVVPNSQTPPGLQGEDRIFSGAEFAVYRLRASPPARPGG